ncbi:MULTISPECIES: M24 family metallopeptidase [unclassified Novosphingobium]|uniref:M24 family metallopeptidase n=1 Tax=unclassified Novosphingobium TaxID=2644732 RepID=UPI00135BCD63|nr:MULTISPECIES: M24 family metallopeptidase [unclassified Novosphingobium]
MHSPFPPISDAFAELLAAERKALGLLDAIEAAGLIAPGRSELEVEGDIFTIAARDFGVTEHWHDRVVRAGVNTLCVAGEAAPDRVIGADDMVFLDLGPVFGGWEADVGRSYAVGGDPRKHALCADLPVVFEAVKARFDADRDITGAQLYDIAHEEAQQRGWLFGGQIAGHLVGEFPYARTPGDKTSRHIRPGNNTAMRAPDAAGLARHWILEIHLVSPDRGFGGFYERLLEG